MSTKEKTISLNNALVVGGGNSFYLHDVPGNGVDIEIKRNGTIIHLAEDVQEGWEYWGVPLPGNDRVFDSVKISCDTANAIKVETSLQRTRLNRAAGSVDITNVIPGVKNQNSLDDAHFHGGWNFNAANFAHMQIFNPAASGIKLIIDSFIFSISSTANPVYVCRYNTALSSSTNQHSNKIIDGAVPAGQLRYVNFTGSYGNIINEIVPEAANKEVEIINDQNSPIILTEGKGILVRSQVPAASMRVRAEWEEIPA